MKLKKLMTIATIILGIGGLIMFFTLNGDNKLSQEDQRNRQYEVSLVKALKNSYRDIEEIKILDSNYYEKPGNWGCSLEISFLSSETVSYNLGHSLQDDVNRSAVAHPNVITTLKTYYGQTNQRVHIIFSNGEESLE